MSPELIGLQDAPTIDTPKVDGNRRRWMHTSVIVLPLVAAVTVWLGTQRLDDPFELTAVAGAVVIGSSAIGGIVFRGVLRPSESPRTVDLGGLTAVIDGERIDGCVTRSLAAAVIELRGIAADTVVDGADAWSEPVGVIARRLTEPNSHRQLGSPVLGRTVSVLSSQPRPEPTHSP